MTRLINYLLLIITLGGVVILLSVDRATAQQQPTPSPTVTVSATATSHGVGTVTYEQLLQNVTEVSDRTLNIVQLVLVIIAGSGILGSYFGISEIMRFRNEINTLRNDLSEEKKSFTDKVAQGFESLKAEEQRIIKIESDLDDAYTRMTQVANRLWLLLEARDADSSVRLRAVQQLGRTNDISSASILVECLISDSVEDVRAEAAYGLGQLLSCDAKEPSTLTNGIRALVTATKDTGYVVRIEAIQSLRHIMADNVLLPRDAVQRFRELAIYDAVADVRSRAATALEEAEKQRNSRP